MAGLLIFYTCGTHTASALILLNLYLAILSNINRSMNFVRNSRRATARGDMLVTPYDWDANDPETNTCCLCLLFA